jgi:hypothetical protein
MKPAMASLFAALPKHPALPIAPAQLPALSSQASNPNQNEQIRDGSFISQNSRYLESTIKVSESLIKDGKNCSTHQ